MSVFNQNGVCQSNSFQESIINDYNNLDNFIRENTIYFNNLTKATNIRICLSEDVKEAFSNVKKYIGDLINKIVEAIKNAVNWLIRIPARHTIINSKDKVKEAYKKYGDTVTIEGYSFNRDTHMSLLTTSMITAIASFTSDFTNGTFEKDDFNMDDYLNKLYNILLVNKAQSTYTMDEFKEELKNKVIGKKSDSISIKDIGGIDFILEDLTNKKDIDSLNKASSKLKELDRLNNKLNNKTSTVAHKTVIVFNIFITTVLNALRINTHQSTDLCMKLLSADKKSGKESKDTKKIDSLDSPDSAFFIAIKNKNIKGLRIMMKNSLLVNPSFNEFNRMTQRVKDIPGMYDKHDGREFETDKSKWNDKYMSREMVRIVGNFSHERVKHLKEVVRYLHPPKDGDKAED
jgi:signal peptidase I